MNSTELRKRNTWGSGLLTWLADEETACVSVVFSWQLPMAYSLCVNYKQRGMAVLSGGPAVANNPKYLKDVSVCNTDISAFDIPLLRHNPQATFTSRGCIRKCSFCAVPKIEGDLVELKDWEPRPIVCDNNLLACSVKHFDRVIDRLKPIKKVDFNQGLDARLLTKHHASRLAELDLYRVRLAWDHIKAERDFMRAFELLTSEGIKPNKIGVYILIGYNDTRQDALYRLEKVKGLGAWTNPMRYQPVDTLQKNSYVGNDWTDSELKRFMRYWSNLRYTCNVPFGDFMLKKQHVTNDMQLSFI